MTIKNSNHIKLSGPLTTSQVAVLFAEGPPAFTGGECVVDFAEVKMVDSAALGLLLSWLRAAQRVSAKLILVNVPNNLHSLANTYGVESALSLSLDQD